MRIVIDSNVWISALVFGGKPRQIFERAIKGDYVIVVSEEIFTEVRRVISEKFTDFIDDFEAFQTAVNPRLVMVKLGSVRVSVSRDKDDNRVIETAIIGGASHIISGDKDLLVLSKFKNIEMITAVDFLDNTFKRKS